MTAVGIICEYNPFHFGHKHQIEMAKKLSACDACVCVMSGSFVQRGDIAVFDKWQRAKAALANGADLVIELPVWYVLQSADAFAYGGIEALAKSKLADALSFGSESGDKDTLLSCGQILANESKPLKKIIEDNMGNGMSYPMALQNAMESIYPKEAELLKNPNDMLGASYIKASIKQNASLEIFPVKRLMAQHGSNNITDNFASSTAIRELMDSGKGTDSLLPYEFEGTAYSIKNIERYILGFYRNADKEKLKKIPTVEEGFENKLVSAALSSADLDNFYNQLVSKRYTLSRVKRTVLAGLLGLEKGKTCDYIRILGMTDKGARLLKEKKDTTGLPFVVKTADFTPAENSMFPYDISATDIAALCAEGIQKGGRDYYTSPVIINN